MSSGAGGAPGARGTAGAARGHADRAAQFMPFAALTGFYDLVREQERTREPRREVREERAEEISSALSSLRRGDLVRVTHYADDAYVTREGIVARIETNLRILQVVRTRIRFDDLWEVVRLDS